MYQVSPESSQHEFLDLWDAAKAHLDLQVDGGIRFWLCMWPWPSAIEHHCFRLGNQIFLIRVVDADGRIEGPGSLASMRAAARGLRAHFCLLPMKRSRMDGRWLADRGGWGLVSAQTGQPVDPVALVTEQAVVMTDWEVHHFAVGALRHALKEHGRMVTGWHCDPRVFPTIWFSTQSEEQQWIVVRAARYPKTPSKPRHWRSIVEQCRANSSRGHFQPVVISCDSKAEEMIPTLGPLLRGHPLQAFYPEAGMPSWAG